MERCRGKNIGARHVAAGEESDADGADQGNAEKDAVASGVYAADGGGFDAIDDDAARWRRRLDASPTTRRRRRMETAQRLSKSVPIVQRKLKTKTLFSIDSIDVDQ